MRSLLRAQLFFLVAVLAWTRAVGALGAEPSPGQPAMETPKALEDEFPEIRQAGEKLRQGDIDGARELLDKLVEAHPELPPAALLMARFFAQANDRAGVRHWLQVAVADEPDDPEAYVLLGDLNMQENRFAEADALYEEALERVEDTQAEDARSRDVALRALVGRSAVAEVRSEWDTARGYLEQVLAERPNDSGVLQRLARVLFQQGKAEEALEKLRAAAKADPTVLTPEATMAQFYEQAGDRQKATESMIAALKARPRDLNTRLAAAQWALSIGQFKTAEQQAEAALILDPKSTNAQVLRGIVAMFLKDYATAAKFFQQAYLQEPNNFAASNYLALALAHSNEPQQRQRAFEFAENNVRRNPDHQEAYSTLGWTLYRIGRLEDAERAFQTVVAMGPLPADTAYYWARLNADRGNRQQAIELAESALKTSGPFFMRPETEQLLEQLKKGQSR